MGGWVESSYRPRSRCRQASEEARVCWREEERASTPSHSCGVRKERTTSSQNGACVRRVWRKGEGGEEEEGRGGRRRGRRRREEVDEEEEDGEGRRRNDEVWPRVWS